MHSNNIFLISLARDDDRREKLIRKGINKEIVKNYFKATHYKEFNVNELDKMVDKNKVRERYHRDLKPAEIACAISHRRAYQEIIDRDLKYGIIFEDDVIPTIQMHSTYVNSCIDFFMHNNLYKKSIIIHLGAQICGCKSLRKLKNAEHFYNLEIGSLVDEISSIWMAHAYIISNKAAKKIITKEKKISYLADDFQIRARNKTISNILVTPVIFKQDESQESNIGERSHWGERRNSLFSKILNVFSLYLLRVKGYLKLIFPKKI